MRKLLSVIIDNVIAEWIGAGMGAPDKFLIDNGGEFDHLVIQTMTFKFYFYSQSVNI